MAQAAEQAVEDRRKFWRRDIWIILAVTLVSGGGIVTYIFYQLEEVDQQKVADRTAVVEKLKDFDLPLYADSSIYKPEGSADIWCNEWKDNNPTAVEFRSNSESREVKQFYDAAAREAGYKRVSSHLSSEVEYHHEDGRVFALKYSSVSSRNFPILLALCFIDKPRSEEVR